MRTTIAAAGVALALLAGCGAGDNDTALTPGSSEAPTVEPSAAATASATASAGGKASTKAKAKKTSSSEYDGPFWNTDVVATGDSLPLKGPLLPEHPDGAPYPASQLAPEFAGDAIIECDGYQFPVDRLRNPRPASDLSAAAKKPFKGYMSTDANGIVAVADGEHVIILEGDDRYPGSYEYAEAFYQVSDTGKERWWVDTDYPPSSCYTSRALPDLDRVFWKLAVRPKPGDRSVQVTIQGQDCGAQSATDRVKAVVLAMTADRIRIVLAQELAKNCGKVKAVRYTIALPEPIGDRTFYDVATYPEAEADAEYPTGEFAEPED